MVFEKNNDKTIMVAVIDDSALKDIFEGKNKGKAKDLLTLLKKNSETGKKMPFKIITPIASFLRAIWLADPKTTINDIQKTLSFLEVHPSLIDFKNKDDVQNEVISLAKRCGELSEKAVKLGESKDGVL